MRDSQARAMLSNHRPHTRKETRSAVRVRSSALLLQDLEVKRRAMPRPRMESEPSLLQDVRDPIRRDPDQGGARKPLSFGALRPFGLGLPRRLGALSGPAPRRFSWSACCCRRAQSACSRTCDSEGAATSTNGFRGMQDEGVEGGPTMGPPSVPRTVVACAALVTLRAQGR